MSSMDKMNVLFEHFMWWEEHHEEMNSPYINKYDWIDELRQEFYKECISFYISDPKLFHEWYNTPEFREQIDIYRLTPYVEQIICKKP